MHIEVQNTDWLYLTERARLCTDEKFLFTSLDASQDSQSAEQKDLSSDSGLCTNCDEGCFGCACTCQTSVRWPGTVCGQKSAAGKDL